MGTFLDPSIPPRPLYLRLKPQSTAISPSPDSEAYQPAPSDGFWLNLHQALMTALTPFSEARLAGARALAQLERQPAPAS
jgi:hypothetical protein